MGARHAPATVSIRSWAMVAKDLQSRKVAWSDFPKRYTMWTYFIQIKESLDLELLPTQRLIGRAVGYTDREVC
jgi:hypothetical protein